MNVCGPSVTVQQTNPSLWQTLSSIRCWGWLQSNSWTNGSTVSRPWTVNHSLCWRCWGSLSVCAFQVLFIWQRFQRPASRERKQTLICFPTKGSLWASEEAVQSLRPIRTRMFGLENDFATPSAPFSNCPEVITLSPFHLRKKKKAAGSYCSCSVKISMHSIFITIITGVGKINVLNQKPQWR